MGSGSLSTPSTHSLRNRHAASAVVNKGGKVSGAWEGAGDTLFHVQAQGHGSVRLHVQKARWSSSWHKQTLQLAWTDGEGFSVEDKPEFDDATIATMILDAVLADPGIGWSKIRKATPGIGEDKRASVRDGLLARGELVNIAKTESGEQVALDHLERGKLARLYPSADPTIRALILASGSVQDQLPLPQRERGNPAPISDPDPKEGSEIGSVPDSSSMGDRFA